MRSTASTSFSSRIVLADRREYRRQTTPRRHGPPRPFCLAYRHHARPRRLLRLLPGAPRRGAVATRDAESPRSHMLIPRPAHPASDSAPWLVCPQSLTPAPGPPPARAERPPVLPLPRWRVPARRPRPPARPSGATRTSRHSRTPPTRGATPCTTSSSLPSRATAGARRWASARSSGPRWSRASRSSR